MKKHYVNICAVFFIFICFLVPVFSPVMGSNNQQSVNQNNTEQITIETSFSDVHFETYGTTIAIRVSDTNYNKITPGHPVIPAYLKTIQLPFGSKITDVSYTNSTSEIIPITGKLATGSFPGIDTQASLSLNSVDSTVFSKDELYPSDWISYHTGGGLDFSDYVTFFTLRVYPARYNPIQQHVHFIQNISVNITYQPPEKTLLDDKNIFDLLIIAPEQFHNELYDLVEHKQDVGIKTNLVSVREIIERTFWQGRDDAEKIKYFIKRSVEEWGVSHVLLVGGLQGQTKQWNVPVRYSHVVPPTEQEYAEQFFISDLYFADIYDSTGSFSSWDSNNDDVFAEWNEEYKEEMDLYPDVYLGRLPCRNKGEVKTLVNKIITYETDTSDDSWFTNLILVVGDSYPDESGFNEGRLIAEKAIELMPDFTPVKVYASFDDINRKTVNNVMNQGGGFAYFCGHGSPGSWSTHFPPDGTEWTTGYNVKDMIPLHNGYKLPITVVGGFHNGQFDVGLFNMIEGILEHGLKGYFFDVPFTFYYNEWVPNCWAWWLTSKPLGGAIATIANTGLGTHGEDDSDFNGIADYLEVLDGWLELRFLELYGKELREDLGENHGQTMTEYLHRFLGDEEKMDTKMVQQWELFGDPSLKINGYQ
jgi:hypothetical protein